MRAKIRENLQLTMPECFIPELGEPKTGKVRDIYFSGKNVVMVTNDRVSAFDYVLPNLIPFKGQVLNAISEYTMRQTSDILPNALVENVDPSVVVQRKMRNLNVEWIVRGYLWGSMAAAYEKGDRTFCGLDVPGGLLRFQKFDEPIFTPTTKAEVGHDENMTMAEVEALVGVEVAKTAKQAALKLFARGQELMRKRGLILIDTKYEFGLDDQGALHVIDEVNTPDSSRLCDVEEWEAKYPKIAAEMAKGEHKTVSDLLKARPDLKMKEFSKQYVRDALLDMGFDPSKQAAAPRLSDDQVVECALRYVTICERITERQFAFPSGAVSPQKRVLHNLQSAGLIAGCTAVIMAGSDSDMPHLETLKKELAKFKVPSHIRICSAHKQPTALQAAIEHYNKSIEPLLIVGCAGGTDALSGTASYLSVHPVVSCPPDGLNNTCLTNPPGSSNCFVAKPANVAKFAAQAFAGSCPAIAAALDASIQEKITKLEKADADLQAKTAVSSAPVGAAATKPSAPAADVLVVGSGGREHAIAAKLAASPRVRQVYCAPGNGGTAKEPKVSNVAVADSDVAGLVAFAVEKKVALVFVGPEVPLCAGLADACKKAGVPCFGPSKAAAELEASKAFSKSFFAKHKLPTAAFRNFTEGEHEAACEYVSAEYAAGREVVVKASGIAAGKGVLMPASLEEALQAVKTIMVDRAFGDAGKEIVVEQLLLGEECSCMAFCDGKTMAMMPAAQDHKRALDGDQGPNTGGMGAYAPAPCLTPQLRSQVEQVLRRTVDAMASEGRPYVGVLYGGFMLTKDGPLLLEYNCRFGDPETEVLLPLLESDLFEVALGCAEGSLSARVPELKWKAGAAATVVCAAKGYPGSYPKGLPISGLEAAGAVTGVQVYHAGTKLTEAGHVSSGGRVLAVTGVGADFRLALQNAYAGVAKIAFNPADGLQFRRDIGHKALDQEKAGGLQTIKAVSADIQDAVKVRTALVSVFDKAGLEELGTFLAKEGVHILSTGGTAAKLRQLGCTVQDVADYTGSPEILDGRVKTLHPKVHGGLLAARGNAKHEAEMSEHGIRGIDLVVVNLYPFAQAVGSGGDFSTCIENIDIGGPAMIRASAKNNASAAIVTSPAQYPELMRQMAGGGGCTKLAFRRNLAAAAFALTAAYDASVSRWLGSQVTAPPDTQSVTFRLERPLKYGCNPHQVPAALCAVTDSGKLPFEVESGTPGYINLLDAMNAWQLVHELSQATGMPAAASFKHVSPAGAAIGVPLSDEERIVYEVKDKELTPVATAYVRARNADPMCSFGDFVAISHEVDLATANILKIEVSDGIIAPGFQPEALEVLKAKKQGKFIVLRADAGFVPPQQEYRMVGGMGFVQRRNDELFDASRLQKVVTQRKELSEGAKLDLILASIAIKYTQSNSVGYAKDGMMVGVGAGQQSRVDCVKLAARKTSTWRLRFHPKVTALAFKAGVKRQDRVNARVRYIEGDMQEAELQQWEKNFEQAPAPLVAEEKAEFLRGLTGVAVSSDAFFPFRDSIDACSRIGVSYVAQPGGSVADEEVIAACDAYGMAMAFTGLRLFHH